MANRFLLLTGLAISLGGCNFRQLTASDDPAQASSSSSSFTSLLERKKERQKAKDLATQDSLNKRYPERVKKPAPVVVHDTIRPKPKTEYVYVKEAAPAPIMRPTEADSLLARLYQLTEQYKANLEFRTELARVKNKLTEALKQRRSALRDTVVYFPFQRVYLEVKELSPGRYQYTLTESDGRHAPPASPNGKPTGVLLTDDRKFYQFREYWLTVLAFTVALVTLGTVKKYDICRRIRQHRSRRLKPS